MHKHTRSRCSLDGRKRSTKLTNNTKCLFCKNSSILTTNQYLFLTVNTINELQNHSYKKTINSLIQETKHDQDYINYKYVTEYFPEQDAIEQYIKKKNIKTKSDEVIEFYKYYQDLPRVFIEETDKIINTHNTARRFLFYRGLKKQLGLQISQIQKRNDQKLDLQSKVLKGLTLDESQDSSLSWSVLLMQKKLAKAIKNNNQITPRSQIQKIDREYSFHKLAGYKLNEVMNIKQFNNLSNINDPNQQNIIKSPKILDFSTKLDFKTLFLKKNTHKQLTTKKSQPIFKIHKKQKSMEDVPKVLRSSIFQTNSNKKKLIGSATSSQIKFASPIKKSQYNQIKRLSSGDGVRLHKKASSKKIFASGDVSCFTHTKLNTSQDKYFNKTKTHQRIASEQLDTQKKVFGNWTPQQKMRITINQKNVVHITLGNSQKSKITRKPKR